MTDSDIQERLEAIRRSLDVRIDSQGDWWEAHQRFTHPGVIAALNRGLGLHPDSGEAVVRIGTQWCYIHCDVTPFVVRKLVVQQEIMTAYLNTGQTYSVDQDAFRLIGDALFVTLDPIGLARLSRSAQSKLGDHLDIQDGQYVLRWSSGCWPIRGMAGTEPEELKEL